MCTDSDHNFRIKTLRLKNTESQAVFNSSLTLFIPLSFFLVKGVCCVLNTLLRFLYRIKYASKTTVMPKNVPFRPQKGGKIVSRDDLEPVRDVSRLGHALKRGTVLLFNCFFV